MREIIKFLLWGVKTSALSGIFMFFNLLYTLYYSFKYIVEGEHAGVRFFFGLIYIVMILLYIYQKTVFVFVTGIIVTLELYHGIKDAINLS
jgi:hypothetical protein